MRSDKVIVIGGGLAGVATLFELSAHGIPATLLEAREALAMETSHANGGMVSPSMSDPWNSPGVGRHLFASLFDPSSGMKLRLHAIPGLGRWGLEFLRHSLPQAHQRSTLANYRLASYSAAYMDRLREDLGLDYDAALDGTMKIFETEEAMAGPLSLAESLQAEGLTFQSFDRRETVAKEPHLEAIQDRIAGALLFPDDRTGDARKFTLALAEKAVEKGGEIRLNETVSHLVAEAGTVTGVALSTGERLTGDVVLAAGVPSPDLTKSLGVRIPIRPAKGYSVTFDAASLGNQLPKIPVVDDAMHTAVVPIGTRLRVVGTAEFTGRDKTITKSRIDALFEVFGRIYPHLAKNFDRKAGLEWAGLRPMSADGRPFIGASPVPGLWLNCAHGHLGFTKSVGSAKLLVDLMQGSEPEIDPQPFSFAGR